MNFDKEYDKLIKAINEFQDKTNCTVEPCIIAHDEEQMNAMEDIAKVENMNPNSEYTIRQCNDEYIKKNLFKLCEDDEVFDDGDYVYNPAKPEMDRDVKDYVQKHVSDAIAYCWPISALHEDQLDEEDKYISNALNTHFAEQRRRNNIIAYTVGEIARATTNMLLEYTTQCQTRVEMVRFVDKEEK